MATAELTTRSRRCLPSEREINRSVSMRYWGCARGVADGYFCFESVRDLFPRAASRTQAERGVDTGYFFLEDGSGRRKPQRTAVPMSPVPAWTFSGGFS
jgi:hypothetical protein